MACWASAWKITEEKKIKNEKFFLDKSKEYLDNKEKLLLKFEDNGAGIPLSIQPQIFEPSFTTKNSGMGLGLAIVKSNLAQIGADIWFESTANKGTTFYVLIPIIKQ